MSAAGPLPARAAILSGGCRARPPNGAAGSERSDEQTSARANSITEPLPAAHATKRAPKLAPARRAIGFSVGDVGQIDSQSPAPSRPHLDHLDHRRPRWRLHPRRTLEDHLGALSSGCARELTNAANNKQPGRRNKSIRVGRKSQVKSSIIINHAIDLNGRPDESGAGCCPSSCCCRCRCLCCIKWAKKCHSVGSYLVSVGRSDSSALAPFHHHCAGPAEHNGGRSHLAEPTG